MGIGGKSGRGRRLSPEEDAKRYREGYPGLVDEPDVWDNLKFYQGEIPSRSMDKKWPEDYIDTIHSEWRGKYDMLERHHSWVQWLFPIREQGVNRDSQPLTCAEREAILDDAQCKERLSLSYELALDFYGFVLANRETGDLERTAKWEAQFANLNKKTHNFLRLTRILKWLGEFGLQHYQAPLVRALAKGVFESPFLLWDMRTSLMQYFVPVVKDDAARAELEAEVAEMDAAAETAWSGGGGSRRVTRGGGTVRPRDSAGGREPAQQKQRWQREAWGAW